VGAIATTITATIRATAKILARAVVACARRIILRGIVARRKVLRSRSVGFGLALIRMFGVEIVLRRRLSVFVMVLKMCARQGTALVVRSVILYACGIAVFRVPVLRFFRMELLLMRIGRVFAGARKRFAW
jgi:hypothetical protein